MKILLLNPPGSKIYLRDYYCSKISKSGYILHPVDLYMLSGTLSKEHKVSLIDAIADNLSPEECHKKIKLLNPEVIVFLSGQVSFEEDAAFLKMVKYCNKQIRLIGTGDIFMQGASEIIKEYPFIEAVILDFTTRDILMYLKGERAQNIVCNDYSSEKRYHAYEFELIIPKHKMFLNKHYTSPFMKYPNMVTVLTDYGCPFKCDFCIMNSIGYKYRGVENVLEELEYIKSLGVREIFFDDQTFGAMRGRTEEILKAMKPMNFSWSCLTRLDILDEDYLNLMQEAGCHMIMVGIESGSQRILDHYHKGTTKEKIKASVEMCRRHNIGILGTFLIGLPEETKEDILKTIAFSKEVGCDYASFNLAVPRKNTRLFQHTVAKGLGLTQTQKADQSGAYGAIENKHLSKKNIKELRSRAVREFYLRPIYLWRRLLAIKTWYEFKTNFKQALGVLKSIFIN
jgi:radical SAM superfamily enzyme YgiQ (UPF0313 family)